LHHPIPPDDPASEALFDGIADALVQRGYAVVDGGLPPDLSERIFLHISALDDRLLQRAGIGRDRSRKLNRFVRGDLTRWLSPDAEPDRALLDWMEELRQAINRRLFLGLFDYEAHYARYRAGTFYRLHRDAFAGDGGNRVLSTVVYLNPGWTVDDGGELRLYDDHGPVPCETLLPVFGRLLVFLSERFPHEVRPTRRTRYSVAGWFRRNGSVDGQVDPPS
jgi:SM-20-related protein